jgi:hypothetical protein
MLTFRRGRYRHSSVTHSFGKGLRSVLTNGCAVEGKLPSRTLPIGVPAEVRTSFASCSVLAIHAQDTTAQELVLKINSERTHGNLSSVIRQYILSYYRERFMR